MAEAVEDMPTTRIRTLAEVERDHILETLKAFDGRKAETAKALGICLKTLYNRLNSYELGGLK